MCLFVYLSWLLVAPQGRDPGVATTAWLRLRLVTSRGPPYPSRSPLLASVLQAASPREISRSDLRRASLSAGARDRPVGCSDTKNRLRQALESGEATQRSSGGGKPYLMRMVGTLYPVAISPSAPPAALEAAARDRLRTLGRQGKSGGTNVLAGYGSVRVDGM